MRFMDIDLDGATRRALLRDDLAPKTCEAIWNALPFEGSASHALVSGQGFRLVERIPVGELPLESPTYFRHPGQLSFNPPNEEIGFCAGESRFAAHRAPQITPFAELEGDFDEWVKRGDDLQFTGIRPLTFRQAADDETPFRHRPPSRTQVAMSLEGAEVTVSLLEDLSPATSGFLREALPITAQATNSTWGGPILRVWMGDEFRAGVQALDLAGDRSTVFHWTGYVYVNRDDGDLRICYADGQEFANGAYAGMTPVGRINGFFENFDASARTLRRVGARDITLSVV